MGAPLVPSRIEPVGNLDHGLVQIFQGVKNHFTVLAEQFGQAFDKPSIGAQQFPVFVCKSATDQLLFGKHHFLDTDSHVLPL